MGSGGHVEPVRRTSPGLQASVSSKSQLSNEAGLEGKVHLGPQGLISPREQCMLSHVIRAC